MTREDLKEFNRIGHRYDQFTRAEVAVYLNRSTVPPSYALEVDDVISGPYTKGQIQTIADCLTIDVDLKRPRTV